MLSPAKNVDLQLISYKNGNNAHMKPKYFKYTFFFVIQLIKKSVWLASSKHAFL